LKKTRFSEAAQLSLFISRPAHLPNHVSEQWHFKKRTPPVPQVPLAYSVHVGEKIAHFQWPVVKNNFAPIVCAAKACADRVVCVENIFLG
jgi:hypothetical protein